jgi:predicted transposase YbfD/YdcC
MKSQELSPFLEHFTDLQDPRTRQSEYPLQELLLVAICAVLSGADNWVDVADWGKLKLEWLRRFLPFENGTASHDTFGRVFALLDAAVFEACFIAWMVSLCPALKGVVAVDGKTIRRSHGKGQKAIHVVSAYAHSLGLTLGQVKTSEKSNEMTAIPELLDALLLKGCLVTIDAMGCQKAIAAKIIEREADYLLMVKNNQPTLAAAVEDFFEAAERDGFDGVAHTQAEWVDGGHGRIETRRCVVAEGRSDRRPSPGGGNSRRWSRSRAAARSTAKSVTSDATTSVRGKPTPATWGKLRVDTGGSRTSCTGPWTCPTAKIKRVCAQATRRKISRFCVASPSI